MWLARQIRVMEQIIHEMMKVLPAGQALGLILLVYMMKVLKEVRDQVREINGSMREMKEWQKGHELLDDERFRRSAEDRQQLWQAVQKKE